MLAEIAPVEHAESESSSSGSSSESESEHGEITNIASRGTDVRRGVPSEGPDPHVLQRAMSKVIVFIVVFITVIFAVTAFIALAAAATAAILSTHTGSLFSRLAERPIQGPAN